MNLSTLRQLWSVVEQTPANLILSLSDTELVNSLFRELQAQVILTTEESNIVKSYILSRTCLIRDLAEGFVAES